MDLCTVKSKHTIMAGATILVALAAISLFVGKYPLTLQALLTGNQMQWRVFLTLRLSRMLVGVIGGFALGMSGFVYQTVFRNPLASPDIIGISSGASAGAAAGILFFGSAAAITAASFAGALAALAAALLLASVDRGSRKSTIVLAGIAVHALAQTALMAMKLMADPDRQLASIEYWIMGSLSDVSGYRIGGSLILCMICLVVMFLLHRQTLLLSA